MTPAFWDASAVVPLCVEQGAGKTAHTLLDQHEITVWWATTVEVRSAFERLLRMGELTAAEYAEAGIRLERLQRGWREIQPSEALRTQAESFLTRYPLKAADALQLAAAWVLCSGKPKKCLFLSGDVRLLEAARQAGFQVITA